MDKDTLYFNIKNTYLQIFDIIIINLQLKTAVLSDARDAIFKKKVPDSFFLVRYFFLS